MSDDQPGEERRAAPRVDVELPARLHVGDEIIDAQTIDISEDAVRIGGEDFPAAREIHIEIELAELGWQRLAADVVRQGNQAGGTQLAATFADAAASGGRSALQEFVRRHLSR